VGGEITDSQAVKKFPAFYKAQSSLMCSKELSTCPSPQSDKSCPSHSVSLKFICNIILQWLPHYEFIICIFTQKNSWQRNFSHSLFSLLFTATDTKHTQQFATMIQQLWSLYRVMLTVRGVQLLSETIWGSSCKLRITGTTRFKQHQGRIPSLCTSRKTIWCLVSALKLLWKQPEIPSATATTDNNYHNANPHSGQFRIHLDAAGSVQQWVSRMTTAKAPLLHWLCKSMNKKQEMCNIKQSL